MKFHDKQFTSMSEATLLTLTKAHINHLGEWMNADRKKSTPEERRILLAERRLEREMRDQLFLRLNFPEN